MAWRLLVVDGADQGHVYLLPETGEVAIGNSQKHADICLHDLYVGRVHCLISVADGRVMAAAVESSQDTFVNGQKIAEHELQLGDVLRVGNSHLRLEDGATPVSEGAQVVPGATKGQLPQLSLERLGDLSGLTLGHYDLGPVLGRGHCGVTFRAHDQKADRTVALRVLSPDFPQHSEEMQRFVRTLRMVLPLRHPNLVTVYGAGKTGPYCWMALEHVEGESAREVIEQPGKHSWKKALRVAIHIGRALEFAYRHHLIHTNITPQNILISTADKVAKVNDLMLAKALEGSQLQLAILEGKLLDELAYLAPEQTPGEGEVDSCSDMHCLGAVVYALLTGRPPYDAASPAELIDNIRMTAPLKPRDFNPSLPDIFEAVVLKMLAKRPEDRFLTPSELLAELEPFAVDEGVKV
jgi:serine/threonine protein kinase